MSRHVKILTGKKFGMLTVLHDIKPPKHLSHPRNRYVLCQCECGRKTSARADHLRSGMSKSCGCKQSDFAFERAMQAIADGDERRLAIAGAQTAELAAGADRAREEAQALLDAEQARLDAIPRQSPAEARHGLAIGEYARRMAEQEGVCAICHQHSRRALAVDHCHKTGRIRGLLCVRCNTGIGMFKDDILVMARAMKYLSE